MPDPFVQSGYARIADDNYQTVDERCLEALVSVLKPLRLLQAPDTILDPCGRNGSAIVEQLKSRGYNAQGLDDAFSRYTCDWLITNPPYTRPAVDQLLDSFHANVALGRVKFVAALLRATFDHAEGRSALFDSPLYAGQIKLRFRPWWTESRKSQPIHSYVWHLWGRNHGPSAAPAVYYWPSEKFGPKPLTPALKG